MARLIKFAGTVIDLDDIHLVELDLKETFVVFDDTGASKEIKAPVRIYFKSKEKPLYFGEKEAELMRVFFESDTSVIQTDNL